MAHRSSLRLITRHGAAITSASSASLQPVKLLPHAQTLVTLCDPPVFTLPRDPLDVSPRNFNSIFCPGGTQNLFFSSKGSEDDSEDDDDDEDEEEDESEDDVNNVTFRGQGKVYTPEEKVQLAADIGYKVVGPLERTERVFTPYEPVFAVVQVGSHQFKVSNRDSIFVERLKFCEVNDKIILNKVMLLGSSLQTIVGRPIVPDAAVHAVVEEHVRVDAKVIIFKKKRRRITVGAKDTARYIVINKPSIRLIHLTIYSHRNFFSQELTKLRITNIEGIEKPEYVEPVKPFPPPKPKTEKGGPAKPRPVTRSQKRFLFLRKSKFHNSHPKLHPNIKDLELRRAYHVQH
ncbi:unnamed protein product [Rhodiola kirilowii]